MIRTPRHASVLTERIGIHPDLATLGELVRDFRYGAPRPAPGAPKARRADGPHAMFAGRKVRRTTGRRTSTADES